METDHFYTKFLMLAVLLTAGIPALANYNNFSAPINLNAASGFETLSGPTLENTRYGNTLIVTAKGFQAFEVVTFSIEIPALKGTQTLEQRQYSADKNGTFETNLALDSFSSPDHKLILRANGNESKSSAETVVNLLPNPSADLDQCANGPFSNPVLCTGSNWQNGNVGQNSGHYFEGDSIPYRMKFDNLTVNGANSVTIEWDTTQGGKHAIDYITSYDRTETSPGNNPCSGVAGAHCTNAPSTFPIPLDPNVSGQGVTQIGGQVFTLWGGTITSVSVYTLSGSYAGNSSTRITINFTATAVNPVLAWGGHIADRNDWAALGGSASDIPGSPYHMRLIDLNGSGGNQDRSLSNVAVRLNSKITIIKQANPETNQTFGFTGTGAGVDPTFNLWDDGVDNDATPNSIVFEQLLAPNTSGSFTIAENPPVNYYELQAVNCTVSSGGTSTTVVTLATRSVNINLQYGDSVTCTFVNNVVTAANVSVEGRVLDGFGNPLSRTLVTITNTNTSQSRQVYTNQLGKYRFDELPVGDFYVVQVSNRKFIFLNDTASFTLEDAVTDLNFTAETP